MITLIFQVHDKGQHPKGTINCAGYKVLTSLEDYLDLLADSLPGDLRRPDCSIRERCAVCVLASPYTPPAFTHLNQCRLKSVGPNSSLLLTFDPNVNKVNV